MITSQYDDVIITELFLNDINFHQLMNDRTFCCKDDRKIKIIWTRDLRINLRAIDKCFNYLSPVLGNLYSHFILKCNQISSLLIGYTWYIVYWIWSMKLFKISVCERKGSNVFQVVELILKPEMFRQKMHFIHYMFVRKYIIENC